VISAEDFEKQLQELEPEEPAATPRSRPRRFAPLILLVLLLAAIVALTLWGLTR